MSDRLARIQEAEAFVEEMRLRADDAGRGGHLVAFLLAEVARLTRESDDNHALWQGALETWEAVASENTRLLGEVARLRRGLEHYADGSHWNEAIEDIATSEALSRKIERHWTATLGDGFEIARAALAGTGETT